VSQARRKKSGGARKTPSGGARRPSPSPSRAGTARRGGAAAAVRPVWLRMTGVSAAALAMLGFVYEVVFRHLLWYGFYDISDIAIYVEYARRMANGARPYRDFPVEYPPLAIPLFTLPGRSSDVWAYADRFAAEMLIGVAIAAVLIAITAVSLWRGWVRPLVVVAVFALSVAFTGAIIANRYDAVVALLLAAVLLCLARGWWEAAALILGLGFALKLTPAILLPLVFLLARQPRRIALCGGFFVLAAFLPWVPYLKYGTDGLEYVFTYHMRRPLQVESVLATPHWIGHLFGYLWVEIGTAYGSQFLATSGAGAGARAAGWILIALTAVGGVAAWRRRRSLDGIAGPAIVGLLVVVGTVGLGLSLAAESGDTVAKASFYLMAAAMIAVYALIWRRRDTLRAHPRFVPVAVLALILAFMTFGKVLSPQYFIWTLPAIALVAVERRTLGALALSVVLLTQIEFPDQYWQFIGMESASVALVVVRNLALAAAFAVSVVGLARLPETIGDGSPDSPQEGRAQGQRPAV
jgi:hypothetical protein